MDTSRTTLLGGLLVLVLLTSGCLGVITGSEPLVLSANEAGVSDAALGGTDFQHAGTRKAWINRTVERAGQEREVRVQNHVSSYERPVAMGADGGVTFGAFVVVSTPQASVAGQSFNPIGRMSHEQMVEQLAGQSADVRDVQREDSRTLAILGTDAEVVRFSGVVQQAGQEVPVYVEVARVEDGDDFVVAVGAYPQATEDEVRPDVTTLFGGIEH